MNLLFTQPNLVGGVLEGVLLKARDENEIKKIPFIAKIFSNAAFDSSLSIPQVNMLLKIVESFTYQQLGLIAIGSDPSRYTMRNQPLQPGQSITREQLAVFMELFDLFRKGVLLLQAPGVQNHNIVLEMNQIVPTNLKLSTPGRYIYQVMDLANYDSYDINKIVEKLT